MKASARQTGPSAPSRSSARPLVVLTRTMLIEIVKLTFSRGHFETRTARLAAAMGAALQEWAPRLVMVDMDHDGAAMLQMIGAKPSGGARVPVIALTRRGDLRMKSAAFDQGVDDILVVPFSRLPVRTAPWRCCGARTTTP